ncbi:MAG: DUF2851 family protein [Allomuricauda sp.]|nr:MAG: DUF2851 family protein [Allomuricauda sp.]
MREEFVQFIWRYQKLPGPNFKSIQGESIVVHKVGMHNFGAGPDFFNSKIEINGQVWAGNVEIHLKSSDWYVHGHETDPNYDNVILHVVWEDDVPIFRKDQTQISTLAVKDLVPKSVLNSYKKLVLRSRRKFINCENDFASVNNLIVKSWLERLYIERLEQKSELIYKLLETSNNDWEKVLFCLLMKNFGLNSNGEAFLSIASRIDFHLVRKVGYDLQKIEALFFGTAGLLDETDCSDAYFLQLKQEFGFLKNKFQLNAMGSFRLSFFGVRPNNFPTIRLSQVANLYHKNPNLFDLIIRAKTVDQFRTIFDLGTSAYWEDHYTFGKISKSRKKKLTHQFIALLIINTIVPIKFCHAKYSGKSISEDLITLMIALKPEKNTFIQQFDNLGLKTVNAMESQSKLHLYHTYCSKNQCLQCAIGAELLNRKV